MKENGSQVMHTELTANKKLLMIPLEIISLEVPNPLS